MLSSRRNMNQNAKTNHFWNTSHYVFITENIWRTFDDTYIIDVLEKTLLMIPQICCCNIPRILTANKNLWNHFEIIYSFTNFYFVFKLIQMIRGSFESRSLILGQCIEFTKPGCRNCNFPSKDNHFANPLVVKRTQSRSLQRPKNYIITRVPYHNYVKPTFPLCIVIYNP